jgi:hypothetical protein
MLSKYIASSSKICITAQAHLVQLFFNALQNSANEFPDKTLLSMIIINLAKTLEEEPQITYDCIRKIHFYTRMNLAKQAYTRLNTYAAISENNAQSLYIKIFLLLELTKKADHKSKFNYDLSAVNSKIAYPKDIHLKQIYKSTMDTDVPGFISALQNHLDILRIVQIKIEADSYSFNEDILLIYKMYNNYRNINEKHCLEIAEILDHLLDSMQNEQSQHTAEKLMLKAMTAIANYAFRVMYTPIFGAHTRTPLPQVQS